MKKCNIFRFTNDASKLLAAKPHRPAIFIHWFGLTARFWNLRCQVRRIVGIRHRFARLEESKTGSKSGLTTK